MVPRDPNILVSVLLPTRGRPHRLVQSMGSLFNHALNKPSIEFLLKVDDDDKETLDFLKNSIDASSRVRVFCSPRGNGYRDMHLWINHLASQARGKWLIIWNDDAMMLTPQWDHIVEYCAPLDNVWHGVDDIICKVPAINNVVGCTAFFFLNRKVVELLGRFSYVPHCDTWVSKMMQAVDSLLYMPMVYVVHDEEHKDKIWQEAEPHRTTSEFTSRNVEGMGVRIKDSLKLHEYIATRKK